MSENQETETAAPSLPVGVPDGSVFYGAIIISYFLSDQGDPIVHTEVVDDGAGNRPSYFEAVAMHGMAASSIDKIYNGDQTHSHPEMFASPEPELQFVETGGCSCEH